MSEDVLDDLLAELEETLRAEDSIPLYDFSWSARGLKRGLSEPQIETLCLAAFDQMSRRYRFTLMWFDWPLVDVRDGRPAGADTPLDFDINTTGQIASPYLVLVPQESIATSE